MSIFFGFGFCFCFAWLAVDAIATGQYVAGAVFIFALVVTLIEMLRKPS